MAVNKRNRQVDPFYRHPDQAQVRKLFGEEGIDHGLLAGLEDDDHPHYLLVADIDDTPVDGELIQPISSNWAYDHGAAADPHSQYRLVSDMEHYLSVGLISASDGKTSFFSPIATNNGGAVQVDAQAGIAYNVATGVATIAVGGVYEIQGYMMLNTDLAGTTRNGPFLRLNSSAVICDSLVYLPVASVPLPGMCLGSYTLSANDTIEFRVRGPTGAILVVDPKSVLNIKRIA